MTNRVIAIDPGFGGALAYLEQGENPLVWDTPVVFQDGKRKYDIEEMVKLVKKCKGKESSASLEAVLENVHSMPQEGVTSAFNFGRGVGLWEGILAALEIPYSLVDPRKWKNALSLKGKGKSDSRFKAQQLYPVCSQYFSREKDHGRADAVLMAVYIIERK